MNLFTINSISFNYEKLFFTVIADKFILLAGARLQAIFNVESIAASGTKSERFNQSVNA